MHDMIGIQTPGPDALVLHVVFDRGESSIRVQRLVLPGQLNILDFSRPIVGMERTGRAPRETQRSSPLSSEEATR